MSLDLNYYLKNPDRFPFPGFFDGITLTWEILEKATVFLGDLLVKNGVKEMNGQFKSEKTPVFYNEYFVGEGTEIYNDVTIIGPVYIGKNCEILPGATIRPYTIISDGCSVGHGSEVKHSVMFGGSKVASLSFVGDSVLGASARVGSGVITANRKFDQTNVTLKDNGDRYDLHSSYFGCILGDSSRLGANSVTQPGTHIGPNSWIFPLVNVRGFIPECTRVFEKKNLVFEENPVIELKP